MKNYHNNLIKSGALVALIGYILSGPVAFMVTSLVKPQPSWVSSAVYAENYHVVQDIPFYFGFLLIAGMLMLSVAYFLEWLSNPSGTGFGIVMALCCMLVFSALITFNYICQTTFVHNMALHYKPEFDSSISAFSMSNPLSFCWANEMWGYAFLGISNWLTAKYYKDKNKIIYLLMSMNGIVSIISVIWTIIDVNWVMTTLGLACYFIWNLLMITMMLLVYKDAKQKSFAKPLILEKEAQIA
jgi:hypothetical protein